MRTNVLNRPGPRTHEGGPAVPPGNAVKELRRAVASCFLWEGQFYEDGQAIADRIADCVKRCIDKGPDGMRAVMDLAVEARQKMNLRHVPLQLVVEAFKHPNKGVLCDTVAGVIGRADEMGELLALYWKGGKKPIPAAMKRGLARAFLRFDAYQLGKYNRDGAVKLKDILRLVHPKPRDPEQAAMWKQVIDGTIASPDTWEVQLSAGADKKATFERLLREGKLGYFALLRNLRGMNEAGVDHALIKAAILARKGGADKILPFRYIAAARAAPMFEPQLDEALCGAIEDMPILPGKTAVLVDVSGSMFGTKLSSKSDLDRSDAACALASIIGGDVRVFSFSNSVVEVPPRRGMAGVDAIQRSQNHGGTEAGKAIRWINDNVAYDRLIVITDEQSHDAVGGPRKGAKGYIINVASYQNGVGYGEWTRINGFSESVLRYIAASEALVD